MSTSRAYRSWVKRTRAWSARTDRPTHAIINRYRNVYALAVDGYRYGQMTQGEAETIVACVEQAAPYRLTPVHTDKGKAWLSAKRRQLEKEQRVNVDYLLSHFDYFEWTGRLHYVGPDFAVERRADTYSPVWTIHLDTGERVEYVATPWQAGGIVEYWDEYGPSGRCATGGPFRYGQRLGDGRVWLGREET